MTEKTMARVVVGVDGSVDSAKAVRWAQQYAAATDASLHLVTAWEWPQSYGAPYVSYEGMDPAADARAVAEKAAVELDLPASQVEITVREGVAGDVLVRAAAGADLLVVGSRGHSPLGSLLLGSVSTYCAHHAPVPVVVVR